MNMSLKNTLLLTIAACFVFAACKKNDDLLDENERHNLYNSKTDAQVKFINAYPMATPAAVTLSSAAASGPGFRIFVDGVKIDGSSNTSSTINVLFYGNNFPATINYATIPQGLKNFKFVINRLTSGNFAPIAGDEVFNTSRTLVAGKKYSMFLTDTIPNPSVFMVEDNFREPQPEIYGIRYINLTQDINARYDLESARHGKVFTNVAYKEVKDFTYLIRTGLTDTFYLKTAGTNTILSQVNTFTAGSQRVYTFYSRGKPGALNRGPSLTFYTNR